MNKNSIPKTKPDSLAAIVHVDKSGRYRLSLKNLLLLIRFVVVFGFVYGCRIGNRIPAEIFLTQTVISKDSTTISTYQNDYSDTADIWGRVINSLKRDTTCDALMYHYDTIVSVTTPNNIQIAFRYTNFPSDSGGKTPCWAPSGTSYDTIGGVACYSIDGALYPEILNRIRKTAIMHSPKFVQSIPFRRRLNSDNQRGVVPGEEIDSAQSEMIKQIFRGK